MLIVTTFWDVIISKRRTMHRLGDIPMKFFVFLSRVVVNTPRVETFKT